MTNLDRIAEIFPECVTETEVDGKLTRAIDFDVLRQLLSDELIDGREAYEFNFVGKKSARREAHLSTTKTLRPDRNLSREFDTTQNLYIEGDNLDALKILQESYLGRVKCIYIDPPYNTGNDFIYRDDFKQSESDFDAASGNVDADGNRLRKNPESNGRFHSDWCAMIYARLAVAKHFLSDDGVIFISIDDHEQATLKLICDELFGERNFVGTYIKQSKVGGGSDSKFLVKEHEYCIVYARDIESAQEMFMPHDDDYLKRYKERDEHGRYFWDTYSRPGLQLKANDSLNYPITCPDGTVIQTRWRRSKERFQQDLIDGTVRLTQKSDGTWSVQFKQYLNVSGKKPRSMTMDFGGSQDGKTDLMNLFGTDKLFNYPKSVKFIKALLSTLTDAESTVLDFFSGSATTAQAVMELNASDGGHRKFIMIQLPEETPEKSEARRAGYKTICDIGRERIRRAGDKLKTAHPTLDTGFRTFKVDESNFVPLPEKITQATLPGLVENIKPDRDAWDLLFGALLDMGLTLELPVTSERLDGFELLRYGEEILACFDKDIPPEIFQRLASRKPRKLILRDASFKNSECKLNALERCKELSPGTEVKVL